MINREHIAALGLARAPIAGALDRCRAEYQADVVAARDGYQQSLDMAASKLVLIDDIAVGGECASAKAEGVIARGRALLPVLKADVERASTFKESKRVRHSLTRDPVKPYAVMGILKAGLMICGEALLNSVYFQSAGMAASPITSLVLSSTISGANVLVGCIAGYSIGRALNYGADAVDSDQPKFRNIRIRARCLQAGYIGLMGFFHSACGLARSQGAIDHIQFSLSAYGELLQSLESVCLVLTGVACSWLAWREGKTAFSDEYLGYGIHGKAIDDTCEAVDSYSEDLFEQVEETFDEDIEEAEEADSQRQELVSARNEAVENCATARRYLVQQASIAEEEVTATVAEILDIYCASGGRPDPAFDIAKHCSFEDYLPREPPELKPVSEYTSRSASLKSAKAEALVQLSALFSDATTNSGEKP